MGLGLGLLLLAACEGQQEGEEKPSSVNRIVYVGNDYHIYIIAPDGTGQKQLTTGDSFHTWPTWSPDGRRIAFSKASSGDDEQGHVGLYYVDTLDGTIHHIYTNEPITQGIAPSAIHYIFWSPDSQKVAFVAMTLRGQNMFMFDIKDDGPPKRLIEGGPVYSSWSHDSRYILAHIEPNREHLLIDLQGDGSPQRVSNSSGLYLSPAWSPIENRVAFLEIGENQDQLLMTADANAEDRRIMTQVEGRVSFLWAPDGQKIALGNIPEGGLHFENVKLLSADGSEERVILEDRTLAFFWSPDGRSIAYVTLFDDAEGVLELATLDVTSDERRILARFRPSRETVDLLLFFEQFAKSHLVWSPDSRYLILAGTLESGFGFASFGSQPSSQILLIDTHGLEPPHSIGEGVLAFWSQN